MILKVFSIYDSKLDFFSETFNSVDCKSIIDCVVSAASYDDYESLSSVFDYLLYELGTFDNQSGFFSFYSKPILIGDINSFVNCSGSAPLRSC